jgi:hypothetical protein
LFYDGRDHNAHDRVTLAAGDKYDLSNLAVADR